MRAYIVRRRSMVGWSLLLGTGAGVAVWAFSPIGAVSLVAGTLCGLANALLVMRGNERLLDHGSVSTFVFSSVLRIFVFGIVPVEFCLHGPWWTMATYFGGFFSPLALYAVLVGRGLRTE